ncbi:GYP5 [Symbiodinium pilosum]|uniref:GYP5 protein n=1 Tax=Symbiodinium pilosum TaxID=2952 RepID=A0A812UJ17_SYMPI|nr:GYP5 [Symbiodinium pilosum]
MHVAASTPSRLQHEDGPSPEVIRQLDLDLPRTAGGDKSLQACIGRVRGMILQHLDEDPELGYCQGMTLVAAVFAAAIQDPEAYKRFAAFVKQVRGLWLPGFPLLMPCMSGFEVLARERAWFIHFTRLGVRSDMFLPQAMLSMFVNWLPLMMLLHCLSFLEDFGLAALLSMAVAFLDLHEARLLEQPTFEELMETLQGLKQAEGCPSELLLRAERGMAEASEALEAEQIVPRPSHGRFKRKGSQVVDEEGKEILASSGLGSTIEWISSQTSSSISDWWQGTGLRSSLLGWAFLQCEAPSVSSREKVAESRVLSALERSL